MLVVKGLSIAYKKTKVVQDVSFRIERGEVVSIIGSNGAGKSTTMRCLAGLLQPCTGEVLFERMRIDGMLPFRIAQQGLSLIPEGARVFTKLSVEDNLLLGTFAQKPGKDFAELCEGVYEIFPILRERRKLKAETLSGGQRQMLAIGRALMARPKLLLLDEPTQGLAPNLAEELFVFIKRIISLRITLLLVEQMIENALKISDRAYILENGQIVMEGPATEALNSDRVRKAYLGL